MVWTGGVQGRSVGRLHSGVVWTGGVQGRLVGR